jgi:multimeric flavodoxin WrbA
MKVIAFNGSARKDGNTAILINHVLLQLKEEGIETRTSAVLSTMISSMTI